MHVMKLRLQTDASSLSQLQAYAARSLDVLRQVEQTVMALSTETPALQAFIDDAHGLLERLRQSSVGTPLDTEGLASESFAKAAALGERLHAEACAGREAVLTDQRLCDDDGVADAYDAFIAAVADYHNVLEDLRKHIETHDALLEPSSETVYDSPEMLFADILTPR